MLRICKRYNVLKNNKEEDIPNHRSYFDVKVEDSTKVSMSQNQTSAGTNRSSVTASEHSATETGSHKKMKRLHNKNVNSSDKNVDDGEDCDVLVAAKKAKIGNNTVIQSTNLRVQPTKNLRHAKTEKTNIKKKLYDADMKDTGRKKKREFDCDSNEIQATVLHQEDASDSMGKRTATFSKSSFCDLQGFEDSAVDDYVSINITCVIIHHRCR